MNILVKISLKKLLLRYSRKIKTRYVPTTILQYYAYRFQNEFLSAHFEYFQLGGMYRKEIECSNTGTLAHRETAHWKQNGEWKRTKETSNAYYQYDPEGKHDNNRRLLSEKNNIGTEPERNYFGLLTLSNTFNYYSFVYISTALQAEEALTILNKFCPHPELRKRMESGVLEISTLLEEVSLYANVVLRRMLDEGRFSQITFTRNHNYTYQTYVISMIQDSVITFIEQLKNKIRMVSDTSTLPATSTIRDFVY